MENWGGGTWSCCEWDDWCKNEKEKTTMKKISWDHTQSAVAFVLHAMQSFV